MRRYRGALGILISGTGSNMQAIVRHVERSHVSADIAFVGSDNPRAPGLAWAQQRGLHTFVVDYEAIKLRPTSDLDLSQLYSSCNWGNMVRYTPQRLFAELLLGDQIERFDCDLLCLAGFMRLLSPFFLERISPDPDRPRIMNIHPSLLPAFPGTDGYGDIFRYGCKVGGCTVHFVDDGEDTGPIIGQRVYNIKPDDTLDSIKVKGLALEHQLYPLCVRLFFERRLQIAKRGSNRVVKLLPAKY